MKRTTTKPIKISLQEYARGIAGGLLFSFPIIYTMEVWWAGFIASPDSLLILLGVTFLLLLGYNRYAGLRPDASWVEIIIDSVEEMGIGIVVSFGILLMLNRFQIGVSSLDEIIEKVVIEAMFVSIGVSVGTAQLGEENDPEKEKDKPEKPEKKEPKEQEQDTSYRTGKTAVAVLALCGSILIGGNVAPTEEVLVIATEAEPLHILIMVIVSLSICALIVSFIDFKGSYRKKPENFLYNLTFDTSLGYVVALISSAFVLWFFGRFYNMSWWNDLKEIITLGVLSSIGASAGRLLIK